MKDEKLIEIYGLDVVFDTGEGPKKVVEHLEVTIRKGEVLGVVGESGSGKSMSANAIMGFIPFMQGKITKGYIKFDSRDLVQEKESYLRKIRGNKISMIFQDPMTSLNPLKKCGHQVEEALKKHDSMSKKERIEKIYQVFREIGLNEPERVYSSFPHELSGGMRQRVMIAMALVTEPELLIADEPTTALDVTVQNQILDILKDLKKNRDLSIIFISHNMDVIKDVSDNVMVMYAGQIMEYGRCEDVIGKPSHPYTKALLKSIPSIEKPVQKLDTIDVILPGLKNVSAFDRELSNPAPYKRIISDTHWIQEYEGDQRFVEC